MRKFPSPEHCETIYAKDVSDFRFGDLYEYYHPNLDDKKPLTALLSVVEVGGGFESPHNGLWVPATKFLVVECSAPQYLEHTWYLPNKRFTRLQQFKILRPR